MDPPDSEARATSSVVGRPRVPLNQIYALPAPIRTFPLPTFYPNNPISLFHLVFAWLKQVVAPPAAEPATVHIGVWDPDTRSVHVKDLASVRALWEQGFYGKGSLSRSEPNWLKRELARRGSPEGKTVSEVRTEFRREERRQAKWERAKAELEALEQQRRAEAASRSVPAIPAVPVEPSKLSDETSNVEEAKQPTSQKDVPVLSSLVVDVVHEPLVKQLAPGPPKAAGTRPSMKPNGLPPVHVKRNMESKAPVGPAELLALPNSSPVRVSNSRKAEHKQAKPPIGPAELLALPNSLSELVTKSAETLSEALHSLVPRPFSPIQLPTPPEEEDLMHSGTNGHADKASASTRSVHQAQQEPILATKPIFSTDVLPTPTPLTPSKRSAGVVPAQENDPQPTKRQKNVRFSHEIESNTFQRSDPPSPKRPEAALPNTTCAAADDKVNNSTSEVVPINSSEIEDKEHFQLSPEEAFFLQFSLGALKVVEPKTNQPIGTDRLLTLLRSHSYFPPSTSLRPDDPFLIHYSVYHHFRSLGWVPRHGIKFGVDWILYQRGPVFDHSEFGIMVMPAYSNKLWKEHQHNTHKKSWSWLMGVNRVLSHVLKSLVIVYVDIPPPPVFDDAMQQGGITAALKLYNIREVMVRRFSVNRNR
ncbi:putative tRNA-splicing endonuclease subunit sen-2 [Cladorrhinum samala]|uniref:tRNA-intron lyase n=1 Tax=Cladorrhinum samala TaxID=585594 RepID=A0AAV9HX65_9PEZI|nr:putative tRNA-splicing endonuclease subunit sen-2 [Cladorrhinum samala]